MNTYLNDFYVEAEKIGENDHGAHKYSIIIEHDGYRSDFMAWSNPNMNMPQIMTNSVGNIIILHMEIIQIPKVITTNVKKAGKN